MYVDIVMSNVFNLYKIFFFFLFWAFMDLGKAYDTIDRHGMCQMLRVYGVGGNLLKTVQSFSSGLR